MADARSTAYAEYLAASDNVTAETLRTEGTDELKAYTAALVRYNAAKKQVLLIAGPKTVKALEPHSQSLYAHLKDQSDREQWEDTQRLHNELLVQMRCDISSGYLVRLRDLLPMIGKTPQ